MRFLVDENVRQEVIDFLKTTSHDVLTVTAGSKDEKIAELAKESRRIIVTHDQHFADILMYPPQNFHGIIRLKFHPPVIPDMLKALEDLFQKYTTQKDFNSKLVVLEKDGFRIR